MQLSHHAHYARSTLNRVVASDLTNRGRLTPSELHREPCRDTQLKADSNLAHGKYAIRTIAFLPQEMRDALDRGCAFKSFILGYEGADF